MVFAVLDVAAGVFDLVEIALRTAFGWRFVLSPRYRAATLARWRAEPGSPVVLKASGALLAFLATAALLVWAATARLS